MQILASAVFVKTLLLLLALSALLTVTVALAWRFRLKKKETEEQRLCERLVSEIKYMEKQNTLPEYW